MSVIPLTVFFSLLLAGFFVVLFLREQGRRHLTSPERDSLLPLADEQSRLAGRGLPEPVSPRPPEVAAQADGHDHDHDHACACRSGRRAACARCLRLRDEQEPAYF